MATHLSEASVNKDFHEERIIYNSPGIPNEKDWDSYTAKQAKPKSQTKGYGFNPCSCVSYARYKTGINVGPIGVARNHPVNSIVPVVGGLAVFGGSSTGHLVAVVALGPETFRIAEYNHVPCKYSERDIRYDDPLLKGFYNE